jgi:hypothetical protein
MRSFCEGVVDRQAIDAEPVLHVLAPESCATSFERGGDDQRIVETERVTLLQLQSAFVKAAGSASPVRAAPGRCRESGTHRREWPAS